VVAVRSATAPGELVLTSLFGDLGPAKGPKKRVDDDEPDHGFAATAIMQSTATEVNERGQMVDRHSHDLVVTGSPAQAIREHFASTRSDLDTATSLITLLDPVGVWASAVIKALSDAGGRPVERLHLREHSTLRTLATIERTTLVRRHEETLRIYHADVRAPGKDTAEIPIALMERSQMTTVIIGPMQPHAIDALVDSLLAAVALPNWRCPNLLFMLPPNAVWIANKVSAVVWPAGLHVHVISESMTGASSVWNAMLGIWNQIKQQPGWQPSAHPPLEGESGFPIKVSELDSSHARSLTGLPLASGNAAPAGGAAPQVMRVSRHGLDPARAKQALAGLLPLEGLLGCAVVDSTTGLVLAREVREDQPVDIDLAAAASSQVLRAHRQAARAMGLSEQIDEVMTSAGPRHHVMRTLSRHPELFLVALLDKQRSNLALARFQLMELERGMH
jgi:predicted regulator of Ras-like GTPase activity (Roadblock/LC7/MglB family)